MTLYVLDPVDGHYRFRPASEDDIREAGLVRSGELELLKARLDKPRSCEWCGCAQR